MFQLLEGKRTHIQAALGALLVIARAFVPAEWHALIDSAIMVLGFGTASALRAGVKRGAANAPAATEAE